MKFGKWLDTEPINERTNVAELEEGEVNGRRIIFKEAGKWKITSELSLATLDTRESVYEIKKSEKLKEKINEGTWAFDEKKAQAMLKDLKQLKSKYFSKGVGDDDVWDGIGTAEMRIEELIKFNKKNPIM